MFCGNDTGRDFGENLICLIFGKRSTVGNVFTKYSLLISLEVVFMFSHFLLAGWVELTVC